MRCSVRALSFMLSAIPAMVGATTLTIYQQPQDLTVHVGDSAVFTVVAQGADTIQWFRAGMLQPTVGSKLVLSNVALSDDGSTFTAVAKTTDGAPLPSRTATLHVLRPTRQLVTLTGELSDRFGQAIGQTTAVSQDIVVDLFKSPEGTDTVYSEAFLQTDGKGVTVENGKFMARLGSGRILLGDLESVARQNQTIYVQFSLGQPTSREVLLPRIPMTAMPFALSGGPGSLKGVGQPNLLSLVAPVGTTYTNTADGTTWIRTFKSWVKAQ
jgi:hypothetical protein